MAARDLEDTNILHLLDAISELAWAAATEFYSPNETPFWTAVVRVRSLASIREQAV